MSWKQGFDRQALKILPPGNEAIASAAEWSTTNRFNMSDVLRMSRKAFTVTVVTATIAWSIGLMALLAPL
ncbi:MAG: hypothetical protein AAB692_05815, partial [Patescibacteria group bacterium]